MSLFTLTSASGSLGVTTLCVGLALTWPRAVVLVEADPSGGSAILAGYCTGLARPGLSELVLAHRHHQLVSELPSRLFPLADSNASLLPGLRSHQQASSLLGVWDSLLDALREMAGTTGADVIVDAGRLGMVGSPEPLVSESDVTVVLTGTGLPELARVRSWVPQLQEAAVGEVLLAIAGRVRPYSASEITKTLGLAVVGEVAWDPEAARWWSHGEPQRRFERSPLSRSVVALGEGLRALAPRVEDVTLAGRGQR
jgi:hypothetical protein